MLLCPGHYNVVAYSAPGAHSGFLGTLHPTFSPKWPARSVTVIAPAIIAPRLQRPAVQHCGPERASCVGPLRMLEYI